MKKFTLLSFFAFSYFLQAQTTTPLQADRPDQTETPAIVPKGMFQVETGFTFQKENKNSTSNSLPSVLWKYGVNDNFELRLITEFVSEKIDGEKSEGFTPVLIGFKVKLCEEKGIIPKTSFIGHISLPNVANSKYKTESIAPEFRFTMQHTLSEKISLSYNLGCEWNGATPQTTFIYTLTTGYAINNKFGCYAELFGFAPQDESPMHNADAGFTYLINNNFMLDLSAGVGITATDPDHYLALGFSFRI